MGRYSENQIFQGNIDNKNIRDFFKLDMKKRSTDDRIEEVNEMLDKSDYFTDFFSDYFKVSVSPRDALSEDVNVCQTLEKMANYILSSEDEIDHRRKEKPEYVFHTRRDKFEGKLKREMINLKSDDGSVGNIVDNENVVHVMAAKEINSRVPKTQKITAKDLAEDSECGRILREYQTFLDHVDNKLKEKPEKLWRYYSNAKGQVKDDMINVKNMLKGVWGIDQISESAKPDLDIFDFTDFDTVKFLLSLKKPSLSFNYDMWVLWNDFNNTVRKANFTAQENAVHILLQLEYSMTDIAIELDIEYHRLRRTIIDNMVKKVIKVGNKYDAEDPKIAEKLKKRKELAKDAEK